jgi:Manganese containing catalase
MYRHTRELQFTAKPEKPDALFAMKFQEISSSSERRRTGAGTERAGRTALAGHPHLR